MRTTYITATFIALMLLAWLGSGFVNEDDDVRPGSLAEQGREEDRIAEETAPTKVRVTIMQASAQNRIVKIRGKTDNKRTVEVKVELTGTIVNRPIERGTQVAKNDLLCELSIEDRQASFIEAREGLNQARIEYQGALSLKEKGYNSDTAIAGAKARLASAQATLSRSELDLAKVQVRAPFAGIVEEVHQEIGDYVAPGAIAPLVVDMDPMLLVGRVSEQDVIGLRLGQTATGYLRNGMAVSGPVSFIGQQNDPTTRTYSVEVELPNADGLLRSGITTEIRIPVESLLAQKVSPALISLDDAGDLGIRTVNEDSIVEFHYIKILSDDSDGVWVSGLPNRAGVITVGQELVTAGERVDPVFQNNGTLKAQSNDSTKASTDKAVTKAATASLPINLGIIAN